MSTNNIDGIFKSGYQVKLQNRGARQSGITFELKSIFDEMTKQGVIKDTDGKGLTKQDALNLYNVLNKMHQDTNRATNYTTMGVGAEFNYSAAEMKTLAKAAGYEIQPASDAAGEGTTDATSETDGQSTPATSETEEQNTPATSETEEQNTPAGTTSAAAQQGDADRVTDDNKTVTQDTPSADNNSNRKEISVNRLGRLSIGGSNAKATTYTDDKGEHVEIKLDSVKRYLPQNTDNTISMMKTGIGNFGVPDSSSIKNKNGKTVITYRDGKFYNARGKEIKNLARIYNYIRTHNDLTIACNYPINDRSS